MQALEHLNSSMEPAEVAGQPLMLCPHRTRLQSLTILSRCIRIPRGLLAMAKLVFDRLQGVVAEAAAATEAVPGLGRK